MQLTTLLIASLSALVLADSHDSCTCHNGDSYNWRITSPACSYYAAQGYSNSGVSYDSASGRCTKTADGQYLMGVEWEAACRAVATTQGFQCADGTGTCYAAEDEVTGSC